MKKGDKFLVVIILIVVSIVVIEFLTTKSNSKTLVIRSDGKLVYEIELNKNLNKKLTIKSNEGQLTVQIEGEKVRVVKSTCKDKLCVKQGWISRVGESIICLPNRISISIVGRKDSGIDTITY